MRPGSGVSRNKTLIFWTPVALFRSDSFGQLADTINSYNDADQHHDDQEQPGNDQNGGQVAVSLQSAEHIVDNQNAGKDLPVGCDINGDLSSVHELKDDLLLPSCYAESAG